jgi:hypothetical protein
MHLIGKLKAIDNQETAYKKKLILKEYYMLV